MKITIIVWIMLVYIVNICYGWNFQLRRLQSPRIVVVRNCNIKMDEANALHDFKRRLYDASSKIKLNLDSNSMNYNKMNEIMKDLECESCDTNFWTDQTTAQVKLLELNRLKSLINRVNMWNKSVEELNIMIDIASIDSTDKGTSATIQVPLNT